jgi:hypothetical protein
LTEALALYGSEEDVSHAQSFLDSSLGNFSLRDYFDTMRLRKTLRNMDLQQVSNWASTRKGATRAAAIAYAIKRWPEHVLELAAVLPKEEWQRLREVFRCVAKSGDIRHLSSLLSMPSMPRLDADCLLDAMLYARGRGYGSQILLPIEKAWTDLDPNNKGDDALVDSLRKDDCTGAAAFKAVMSATDLRVAVGRRKAQAVLVGLWLVDKEGFRRAVGSLREDRWGWELAVLVAQDAAATSPEQAWQYRESMEQDWLRLAWRWGYVMMASAEE